MDIIEAVRCGELNEVRALLKQDPSQVNTRDGLGWTPLHYAVMDANKELTELLLSFKPDVNAKDNKGYTPLYWAIWRGYRDIADLLRQHGAVEG